MEGSVEYVLGVGGERDWPWGRLVQTGQMEESGHETSLLLVFDEEATPVACRRATLRVGCGSLT